MFFWWTVVAHIAGRACTTSLPVRVKTIFHPPINTPCLVLLSFDRSIDVEGTLYDFVLCLWMCTSWSVSVDNRVAIY